MNKLKELKELRKSQVLNEEEMSQCCVCGTCAMSNVKQNKRRKIFICADCK